VDPVEYIHRHQFKNAKNKFAKEKMYIEEDDIKNPYYWVKSAPDKKYAGRALESKVPTKQAESSFSSAKVSDARRADKVVAREEVHAKEGPCETKPSQVKSGKVAPKTSSATKASC
jgi:hypothetical protein